MTGNVVARRYAKALYSVGGSQGETEAYGKELMELAEALQGAPEAMRFFRNPLFSADEKKAVLKQMLEKLSVKPMVTNFCNLLADKGRLEEVPAIAADYKAMLDVASGIISGRLVTVKPMDAARQADVLKRLEDQTGKKLELEFADDAEILGGVVLKIGDKVLDASLRAQLQILKDNIKRGE